MLLSSGGPDLFFDRIETNDGFRKRRRKKEKRQQPKTRCPPEQQPSGFDLNGVRGLIKNQNSLEPRTSAGGDWSLCRTLGGGFPSSSYHRHIIVIIICAGVPRTAARAARMNRTDQSEDESSDRQTSGGWQFLSKGEEQR